MRCTPALCFLPGLLLTTLLGIPAAQAAHNRTDRERAARKACLNGEPAKGVAILTDLYVDTLDALYIYNQGRCYEQNSRYQEAIGRFREFLRKAKDTASVADAEKHIADCEAILHKPDAAPPPNEVVKAPEPVAPTPVAPVPEAPAPVPTVATTAADTSLPAPAGSGLRTAGWVTASVGGAALVAGLLLNLKANSMASDLSPNYNKGRDSSRKSYKTFSIVGYGVGAACLAGGAVLYYLGWRAQNQPRFALLPMWMDGNPGAALTGAF